MLLAASVLAWIAQPTARHIEDPDNVKINLCQLTTIAGLPKS
jgi:hypothetical protein